MRLFKGFYYCAGRIVYFYYSPFFIYSIKGNGNKGSSDKCQMLKKFLLKSVTCKTGNTGNLFLKMILPT